MIDCTNCSREKLSNTDLLFEVLDKFPEKMGAAKTMPPYIFKYNGSAPNEWGLSGIVLLADSHITIHTFPDKEHVFVDIFSSKDFDANLAVSYMTNIFGAKDHKLHSSAKNAEFPRAKNFDPIIYAN